MCNGQNIEKNKIVCVDLETTGLDPFNDEILQLSIINGNGDILFNEYIKPKNTTSWTEAEKIHGISSEQVSNSNSLEQYIPKLNKIFDTADTIVGYNLMGFIYHFLSESGICIPKNVNSYDVMIEFASIYGEWNDYFEDYRWQKLSTCTKYYGYDWGNEKMHNSLSDAKSILYCFNKMQ